MLARLRPQDSDPRRAGAHSADMPTLSRGRRNASVAEALSRGTLYGRVRRIWALSMG